jgi:hypothetical protein
MKQEIDDLRAQFEALDKKSSQTRKESRNKKNNNDNVNSNTNNAEIPSQSPFDNEIHVMGQKTNAMADALHRNYARSNQLQRENDMLRKEYEDLRAFVEEGQNNDHEDEDEDERVFFNDEHDENDDIYHHEQHERKKSPESLLRDLDPTDDYIKRKYPPVPKTPGTMFTTELVEVMKLEVGEHAYLAEIMDRQWRTSTDYRP